MDEATVLLQRIYDFLSVSIGILGPRLNPDDERARELWEIYCDVKYYLGVE